MAKDNNIRIIISADDKASKPLRDVANEVDKTSKSGSKLASVLGKGVKFAIGTAVAGASALTGGLAAAATASYSQVKAVEEARFGLIAYEKDASKVDKVLGDLVAYARSDMGVLFNRKDMFAAASTLKMYGNETGTLTERVKILSKGVAQGQTTFQDLSQIVGRAAAKGKLDAVAFDQLISRGIGLDRKFRGAKVSAEELWKELNRALPDKLLAGRANTIEGRMIRLQSAFRGVGDAVLGVDKDTSNFIEGGIGDRIQKGIGGLTDFLKGAAPIVSSSISGILDSFDLLSSGNFKDGMFGGAIKKDSQYVQILTGIRDTAIKVFDYLSPKFVALGDNILNRLVPSFKELWEKTLRPFATFLGATFVVTLGIAIDLINYAAKSASWLITELSNGNPVVWGLVGAFGALAVALKLKAGFAALSAGFAGAMTGINTLRATVSAPMLLGSIGVGAALAALSLVIAKHNETKSVIEQTNDQITKSRESTQKLDERMKKLADNGKISQERYREYIKSTEKTAQEMAARTDKMYSGLFGGIKARMDAAMGNVAAQEYLGKQAAWNRQTGSISGRAVGSNNHPGGWSLVGEHGPEKMYVPRGSQITPSYRTRQEQAGQSSPTVIIENYNSYNERDDDRFFRDLGFALENGS